MSQSLSQIWVHIIFSTKNRYPFLTQPILQKRVHDYISAICLKLQCTTPTIGGVSDHLHILTSLPKNLPISEPVEKIKTGSSKWIKTLYQADNIFSKFYWQRGYAAFSVSQSKLEAVRFYIVNQEKNHKKQSFQDELRKFLVQYDIKYDEKYIWD